MNGKRARSIRAFAMLGRDSLDKNEYRGMKREWATNGIASCIGAPLIERVRKPKAAIKPTWPASADQKAQSRPLIVLKPMRTLAAKLLSMNPPDRFGRREFTPEARALLRRAFTMPKHAIDRLALAA